MTKRRTKGDGGLTQRHDAPTCPPIVDGVRADHRCQGRWQGTLDVRIDGKVRRKYVYGKTQAIARQKLNQANREKEAGTLVVASLRVDAWLTYWLDNIAARRLKPQSLKAYRGRVNNYLTPHLGTYRLTALRPEHIRSMHDWMEDAGKSERTIRSAHETLTVALRDAVREGKLGANPADRMAAPSVAKHKPQSLTLDQARRVLAAASDNPRWWLALFYGMRQGEALGLRWADVDFDHGLLHIRETVQIDEGALILGAPKSGTSARTIPLLGQIGTRLRLLAGPHPDPAAFVFPGKDGPRHPWTDWDNWRQLLVAATIPPLAPIPHVSLHSARQSAASLMEAAGIPDRLVMQILGHANVSMTHGYQSGEVERMRSGLEHAERMLELG